MNKTRLVGAAAAGHKPLPALALVQSSASAQRLAKFLLAMLVLSIVLMALAPWQQTARGRGSVVAFVPQERQQTITSPIRGVIARVAEGVLEGSRVQQGQFIVEVQPVAANLVQQKQAQWHDLQTRLATAEAKQAVYEQNVLDFTAARDYAVKAAQELIHAAEAKLAARQDLVPGYIAKEAQARLNFERQEGLFRKGIKPEKEVEALQKDWDVARAELDSIRREVIAAENEVAAKMNELEQKRREAQTKIDYARGMQEDARGQAAAIRKEMRELEIYLSELQRLVITAPRDGVIYRMPVFERGQAIKEGDPLFTIVPDASERAVELWISGNDVPLVRLGDHVRLQFEGWPAVQFVGWPSVAIGTFGGKVVAVDATDDGNGEFRVLIKQDDDDPWPSDRFLRQGVRANGWVMLNRVTLGYEVWRQLNGFPPVLSEESSHSSKGKATKVKLAE